jgi:sulfite reductase alpha subunit-like flavoprotein
MMDYIADVIGMLDSGAAVYICGGHEMGYGVHDTLVKIMKEGKGLNDDETHALTSLN